MTGRVFHVGQVVVDLAVHLDSLPEPGGDIFANSAGMYAGGGFNVLNAIRQLDVEAIYAGTMGTGPFADRALKELARIGVVHCGATLAEDIGITVAMTDSSAERTFVSVRGAETRDPELAFDGVDPDPDDVLYISGYSFAFPENIASLDHLATRLADRELRDVVVDVSPMVAEMPDILYRKLLALRPIWSVNEREANVLADRFCILRPEGLQEKAALSRMARKLSVRMGRVLVRGGSLGAWYSENGEDAVRFRSIPVLAIDTNGAGDAHSGVLCAALARGESLETALHWANVGGALSTTETGPATCPKLADIVEAAKQLDN